MAEEFTMPKLGLTMTDGTIREWLVPDGAAVSLGDPVLVIETDKVETEVEARSSGILRITGVVGENYECGAVIGQLLSEAEASSDAPAAPDPGPSVEAAPAPAAPAEAAPEPPTVVEDATEMAALAASEPATAAVAAAAATGGDVAARGEGGRILASPRARATARDLGIDLAGIRGSGPTGRILHDDVVTAAEAATAPGAEAPATSPAASATPPAAAPAAPPADGAPTATSSSPPSAEVAPAQGSAVSATGAARLLADLLGIDLARIPRDAGQRLTRDDVAAWVRSRLADADGVGSSPADAGPATTDELPLLQSPSSVIPLRGMRGVIAKRMHQSLTEMAQLTLSVDADMAAVNAERERRKAAGETVPGYTAWVVAAAAQALEAHPVVNSQITTEGVALLPDIHIGVAVALDDGLIVPVIQHTNAISVEETHGAVADLATRARNGKLTLDELEGGTFSVTALGMYGVDVFTPVINPPNTAILGVGRLRSETNWTNGYPTEKTVMTLSLTWDHRAFDGAPAAEFAQTIVGILEQPSDLV